MSVTFSGICNFMSNTCKRKSHSFVDCKTWNSFWFSRASLRTVDFRVPCTICGESPAMLVVDGTAVESKHQISRGKRTSSLFHIFIRIKVSSVCCQVDRGRAATYACHAKTAIALEIRMGTSMSGIFSGFCKIMSNTYKRNNKVTFLLDCSVWS